jgi:hypothetical protein
VDFHRRLEHSWREGSAYFVTWRLDGSLPVGRVTGFRTSDGPKFVEFDRLPDAVPTGPRWLEQPDVARIVVNALLKGERESRYIENNPVKAGLCGGAKNWPWSRAGEKRGLKPRVPDLQNQHSG